jgi:hypothetical protein
VPSKFLEPHRNTVQQARFDTRKNTVQDGVLENLDRVQYATGVMFTDALLMAGMNPLPREVDTISLISLELLV